MKIHIAQQNYITADLEGNTRKIIASIKDAEANGAALAIFSAFCICGPMPADLLLSPAFIGGINECIEKIKEHTAHTAAVIGAPQMKSEDGKDKLFNAALLIHEGEIRGVHRKTCLTDHDIFEESRYFTKGERWETFVVGSKRIALLIDDEPGCIQRSNEENGLVPEPRADLIVNVAASPFDYASSPARPTRLKKHLSQFNKPVILCNMAGANGSIVFDGSSFVLDGRSNLCLQLPSFAEDAASITLLEDGSFNAPVIRPADASAITKDEPVRFVPDLNMLQIKKALVLGIRDYFRKTGFTKAIVGNSGGLDSAVTIALACDALGSENVFSLLMPSQYSSDHSIADARQLCDNLKSGYEILPITPVFSQFDDVLKPIFKDLPQDVTEENLQARIRGTLLMAVANKFNYVLLNTSNKSELSVGYGTLYGDLAGGLSVLGDCYKLQVYALAHEINQDREIIPPHIIHKVPSAELRPNQFDSQSLPPYDLLDPILFQYMERGKLAAEIVDMGYDEKVVHFAIRLINRNEFKRHQFCPIIRVSSKSFGSGRKIPVVARYT